MRTDLTELGVRLEDWEAALKKHIPAERRKLVLKEVRELAIKRNLATAYVHAGCASHRD